MDFAKYLKKSYIYRLEKIDNLPLFVRPRDKN